MALVTKSALQRPWHKLMVSYQSGSDWLVFAGGLLLAGAPLMAFQLIQHDEWWIVFHLHRIWTFQQEHLFTAWPSVINKLNYVCGERERCGNGVQMLLRLQCISAVRGLLRSLIKWQIQTTATHWYGELLLLSPGFIICIVFIVPLFGPDKGDIKSHKICHF